MDYTWINTDKKWSTQSNYIKRVYSAPTVINLEITEGCNFKCLHCYNPWREVSAGKNHLTIDQFDYLLEEFQHPQKRFQEYPNIFPRLC